jgi:PAS domain S-box-containing protein
MKTKGSIFSIVMIALVAAITAIPFVIQSRTVMPIYSFRFNPFALLSAMGLIADVVILFLLARKQTKTFDSFWLIAGSTSALLFAVGETLQRLSVYPETAVFWAQLSGVGLAFAAAAYLLFAVNYTMPERPNAIMTSTILMGAAIIAFFQANGGLFFRTEAEAIRLYPWGYNNDIGPAFIADLLWFALLSFIGVFLILRYRRHARNKILRIQSAIFAAAITVPIVGGVIFDSLLPLFGIESLPPMGLLFFTVNGILMVIGIWKFRVFELSPAILSQNILTTMSEAVLVTNDFLEIEYVNGEAEHLLQLAAKELRAKNIKEVFTNTERIEQLRNNLASGTDLKVLEPIEDMAIRNNDSRKYLRILVSPVSRGGRVEGFIFVISDVTELQQAYVELEAAKAGVERVVEERTRELRDAQQKLLETDKLKTEFIMLASHNLRTPLAAMQASLELLGISDLDGTQHHVLEGLQVGSKRLGTLIDDLLTISSIEASDQPMEKKRVGAAELLDRITKEAGTMASATSNRFDVDIQVGQSDISASPDRLGAAINNILDNAFKFTKNGQVTFRAAVVGEKLQLTVTDTGIGMKADEIPKLFTTFHRGTDTLKYNYEGKGLGLYLAKLIITEHGGSIDVQSEEGKGTVVTITIPIDHSSVVQAEAGAHAGDPVVA